MSPDDLAAYLKVLRAGNVLDAGLELPCGTKFRVTMGPEPIMPSGTSEDPSPGAWKTWSDPSGQGVNE